MQPRGSVAWTGLWLATWIVASAVGVISIGHQPMVAHARAPGRACVGSIGWCSIRTAVDRAAVAPAPILARIRPCAVPNTGPANLSLTGSGFSRNAYVRWLGVKTNYNLPTTFISRAHLTAAGSRSTDAASKTISVVKKSVMYGCTSQP